METVYISEIDLNRLAYHRTSSSLTEHRYTLNLWEGESSFSGITMKECFREHRLKNSAPDHSFQIIYVKIH